MFDQFHQTHQVADPDAAPVSDLVTLRVMQTDLLNASPSAAVAFLLSPRNSPKPRRAFFFNAHCANMRARDAGYGGCLDRADLVLPDGVGVDWAARMTGQRLIANLNGTDLVPALLARAAKQGKSVFLLGGRPGTAARAARAIAARTPGLRIAGTRDGYQGARDSEGAIRAINRSGAAIVLVAMGVPLQEVWIDRHAARLRADLVLGVGGLFDFWAGNVSRAPRWVRRGKAEWVWRLAQEPRRMWRRYLIGNLAFLARAARQALRQASAYQVAKRALDLTLAGGALLLLSPVLVLICALIRLESPGHPVFSQRRIGQDGRPFRLYKLRSMRSDAEARRAALLGRSDRDGICFKSRHDPRITRIGRVLRRFSLDELPQLINVLKGEMSLVGPRPALPEEVAAYAPEDRGRLAVKPGLTGLWQVSGRADVDFKRMVDLDIAYARSPSLLLDLLLIAATFRAVMTGRGAY